eukprot:gene65-71_t
MASRKRKTINIKRVTTRSIGNGLVQKMLNPASIDNTMELQLMEHEERQQRQLDNFWGLDKDQHDRLSEIHAMNLEDQSSMKLEYLLRLIHLHQQWDNDFIQEENIKIKLEKEKCNQQRCKHLELIHSPCAIEEVLQELWNLQDDIETTPLLPHIASLTLNSIYASTVNNNSNNTQVVDSNSHHIKNMKNSNNMNNMNNMDNDDMELDPSMLSLDSIRMPLHLQGLQRSREIIDQARLNIKQLMKDIYNTSHDQQHQQQHHAFVLNSEKPPLRLPTKTIEQQSTSSSSVQQQQQQQQQTEKKMMKEPPPPTTTSTSSAIVEPYNHALLGHVRYQWNQTLMLQAAFNLLDKDNHGYLTIEDLTRISNDQAVHDLLCYTVFWSVIKHKNWDFFQRLLDVVDDNNTPRITNTTGNGNGNGTATANRSRTQSRDNHSRDGGNGLTNNKSIVRSRSSHNQLLAPINRISSFRSDHSSSTTSHHHVVPSKMITYHIWIHAAQSLTREGRVSLKRIRTQKEHEILTTIHTFQHDFWDNDCQGVVRNHRMMRSLQVGDCIWALHGNGVRWLPAIIEYIHTTPPTVLSQDTINRSNWIFDMTDSMLSQHTATVDSYSPYTYDLYYPLTEEEITQARINSTSKQLLTLPSQSIGEGAQPKPFADERAICSYAFDLVDINSTGIMEIQSLINAMQSLEMKKIIENSAILTAIFQGVPTCIEVDNLSLIKTMRKRKKTKVKAVTAPIPLLLPVFIDTFSTRPVNNQENNDDSANNTEVDQPSPPPLSSSSTMKLKKQTISVDYVSKMDFLEFCDATQTVLKYDIHRLRSK